jgi:hypothetical protein
MVGVRMIALSLRVVGMTLKDIEIRFNGSLMRVRVGYGQVHTMFDHLYKNQKMRDDYHIKGWSFQDKSIVPLQAADVLAYEVFKQVTNQILDKGKNYDVRFSMKHLVRATDDRYLKYWGEQRLLEWIKELNLRHLRLV